METSLIPGLTPRARLVTCVAALALFFSFVSTANAQVFVWNNTSSPNPFWHLGGNWTPFGPPTGIDTAIFNSNSSYQVFWDKNTPLATPNVQNIIVSGGNVKFVNVENDPVSHGILATLHITGASTSLTSRGLHLINSTTAITNGGSFSIDGSHAAGSSLTTLGETAVPHGTLSFINGAQGTLNDGLRININDANEAIVNILGTSNITSAGVEIGDGVSQSPTSIGTLNVASGSQLRLTRRFGLGNFGGQGTHTTNVNSGGEIIVEDLSRSFVGRSGTLNVDGGSFTDEGRNFSVSGTLNVTGGGNISTRDANISGLLNTSGGVATISGSGSNWTDSDTLTIGHTNRGAMTVSSGASVESGSATIGFITNSVGSVTVTGFGSNWDSGSLTVGSGTLEIFNRGEVSSFRGTVGGASNSTGEVTVSDTGSVWDLRSDLNIRTTGTINIQNGGLVSVGGTTTIQPGGAVNLSGGRFEFGRTDLADFGRINAIGGALAGDVEHNGVTDVATLSASFQKPNVDVSDVAVANRGTLFGSGALLISLDNQSTGELRATNGEFVRFEGAGNVNRGEINNFGGTIEFARDMTNRGGGFIAGRGVFSAGGGWTNSNVMAFSGTTDILGDVHNETSGQIITSGSATTTFYDDVIHDGLEIRTSQDSRTVFFGDVSGGSSVFPGPGFTGTGTVYMEGDLRPGNSPGVVGFEGDLVFGSLANMHVELAGQALGAFDRLEIAGDLSLDGNLLVDLIDGFRLTFNDEFLIADVGGQLAGQFSGLNEGDLVGNFGGMDLFISYKGGNGNDVSLFTAIPEASGLGIAIIGCIGLVFGGRRRRRVVTQNRQAPGVNRGAEVPIAWDGLETDALRVILRRFSPGGTTARSLGCKPQDARRRISPKPQRGDTYSFRNKLVSPLQGLRVFGQSTWGSRPRLSPAAAVRLSWALTRRSRRRICLAFANYTPALTHRARRFFCAIACCTFSVVSSHSAIAQNTTWLGGAGNWSDAINWSNGVPTINSNVFIDDGNATTSDVFLNGFSTIKNLTLDAGDQLKIANGQRLHFEGTTSVLNNDGLIQLEGTGFTWIRLENDLTIGGTGSIRLNGGTNAINGFNNSGPPVLTNGIDHTIEGAGSVGSGIDVVNQGLIESNVNGETLTVTSSNTFTNNGILRASNGARINVTSTDNVGGGVYEATGNGSHIQLFSGSVTGITFNGINGGRLQSDSILNLHDITNTGYYLAQTNNIHGTLNNSGVMQFRNASNVDMNLATDVTLTGAGEVYFSQGGTAVSGPFTLTNQDNTLSGFGDISSTTVFETASRIAPGVNSDSTASFDFLAPTMIDGTIEFDLIGMKVNDDSPNIGQVNTHTHSSPLALDFDQVNIFDTAALGDQIFMDVNLAAGFTPTDSDFFDILTADQFDIPGSIDFDFPVFDGKTFTHEMLTLFDPSTGTNRDVLRITFGATAIPEPRLYSLLVLGLAFYGGLTTRKRA